MPIDPTIAVGGVRGAEWQIGPVDGRAATGAGGAGTGFGGMLGDALDVARRPRRPRPPTRAQALATGTAEDPTAVVMAVERAQLVDAARLADPHQGRRGRPGHLPHPGLSRPMPRFAQTLMQLPTRSKIDPRPSPPSAIVAVALLPAAARRARPSTRCCPRASTRPRPARSPPRSTSRASPTSCATTAPRSPSRRRQVGAGADRARRRGRRAGERPQRGLRAVRRAEARRLRLPAEGHLPARARGRDRPHDRAGRRRQRRPGPARAARGPALRRRGDAGHRRRHAHRRRPTTLEPGAVRGIAQLVASSVKGLKTDERHDHRRHRPAAVAAGRRAPAAAAARRQAGRRGALRSASWRPSLDALLDAARSAPTRRGAGQRRPQRRQDHARAAHRTTARASRRDADDRDREARGRRRRPPAAPRAPAATSRPTRPAPPAAAATRTTSARPRHVENGVDKTVADDRGRAGRGQQAQRRARGRQDASRRPTSPAIQERGRGRRRHRRRARRHASQAAQIAFAKAAEAPKAGPVPIDACSGRSSGSASASPTLLFLFFMSRAAQAPARGRGARRAELAARDRAARVARRARARADEHRRRSPTITLPPREPDAERCRRSSS